MHALVKSDLLRDGLNKILTVIDRKISRPLLMNCLVTAENNSISLVATDLEVAAKVVFPAEVQKTGTFCINTKNISDIVRELPSSSVEIKLDGDKNLLKLVCQNISYSLVITAPEKFPQINFASTSNTFEIHAREMSNCINKVSHAISNDETRPFLNGIFFHTVDTNLRAVAVDGYRLAHLDIENFKGSNPLLKEGVIVPKKGIYEIKKMADSHPDAVIKLAMDESFIYANANDEYFLFIRLIAREFPKYQSQIPSKTANAMLVRRTELTDAVKRIRPMANEKTNGVKFTFAKDKLSIWANHSIFGEATETVDVNYTGSDMSIGFNVKFLMDTLNVLPEESDVTFEFNNELNPVLVKAKDLPEFLGILMPLRL